MNLGELREEFIKLSGRYDLVSDPTTYADDGANAYITAGIKYLDRLLDTGPAKAKLFYTLSQGSWYALIQNCRAIQEVWVSDTSDRYKVTKILIEDLRTDYAEPPSSLDQGRPLYFAPSIVRTMPETDDQITIDSFGGTALTSAVAEHTYKSLIFMPPADGDYELEIQGLFLQAQLSADDDENYWSVNHPQVVLWAAQRQIEITYRNKEGQKDWEVAIDSVVKPLDFDAIAEDIADFDQIGG